MKCNVLKRAFVLTALGASMATAAFAAPNGPVMIPQPGTVVVINHNPDVTFLVILTLMLKAKKTII